MPHKFFDDLFPDDKAPYTLREITATLQRAYAREQIRIDDGKISRALGALRQNPATRDIVRPLPGDDRFFQYGAEAARRIGRRVVNGQLPQASLRGESRNSAPKAHPNETQTKSALRRPHG